MVTNTLFTPLETKLAAKILQRDSVARETSRMKFALKIYEQKNRDIDPKEFLKMNFLTETQIEKLVGLIKETPVLYNKADKCYKHLNMKEKIWKQIAISVGAEEKDCKTAWKSLRDQFVKATRDIQCKADKKAYKYYDHLLFLKDSIKTRKQNANADPFLDESETQDSEAIVASNFTEQEPKFVVGKTTDFIISTMWPNVTNDHGNELSPGPSKKCKCDSQNETSWNELYSTGTSVNISKSANATAYGHNDYFYLNLSCMIENAKLTPSQTRQIQKKLFNFVVDELDNIENSQYT